MVFVMVGNMPYHVVIKNVVTVLLVCAMGCVYSAHCALGVEQPIATDSRIKTFVYSANEVFPIVLHYGYQTTVEFGNDEKVQTYSVGNNYAWQISVMGSTLFIKPMEENVVTNMILITNKRRYYFELQSETVSEALDQDLVYAIRFFYPDGEVDSVVPRNVIVNEEVNVPSIPAIRPYNFNYASSGDASLVPTAVFDDGVNTFLQYDGGIVAIPQISIFYGNHTTVVEPKRIGNYFVIDRLVSKIELLYDDGKKVTVSAVKRSEKGRNGRHGLFSKLFSGRKNRTK